MVLTHARGQQKERQPATRSRLTCGQCGDIEANPLYRTTLSASYERPARHIPIYIGRVERIPQYPVGREGQTRHHVPHPLGAHEVLGRASGVHLVRGWVYVMVRPTNTCHDQDEKMRG